jgi:hypothetical protein
MLIVPSPSLARVPQALFCSIEYVATTEADPTNPFLTCVIVEGVVVARGASTTKKASKAVRRGSGVGRIGLPV